MSLLQVTATLDERANDRSLMFGDQSSKENMGSMKIGRREGETFEDFLRDRWHKYLDATLSG
jgi:hypothetical protein